MDSGQHAEQAQLAFRALRSASCLHTHASFPFTPAHLDALAAAAADLLRAHAGAASAPAPPAPPAPPPAPLSPCQPLPLYLASLPAAPLALPPLPPRAAAAGKDRDASLAQLA